MTVAPWFTVLLSAAALAQDPGADPTFQTKVNLVLVPVVVRDASGHAVGNLTQADFQLFDKGKPQTISSFSVVERANGAEAQGSAAVAATPGGADSEHPGPAGTGARPLDKNAHPDRYIIYLFDDLNARFEDLVAVREAAIASLRRGMPATDHAAVYTFSGRTNLAFTSHEAALEDVVAKLRLRPSIGHGEATPCPDISYYLADSIVIKNDQRALEAVTRQTVACSHLPEFAARQLAESAAKRDVLIGGQQTRVTLETIKGAIRLLAQMPGQRLIVLASSGFFTQTPEAIRGVAGILELAASAGVIISALDPRGVYTSGEMDASRASTKSSLEQQYYRRSALEDATVLTDLSEGTGGLFFHNNNDLAAGFVRVAAPPEYSYVLGFSPLALKTDGRFHFLKIRLPNRNGISVQARRGYYALAQDRNEDTASAVIHEAVFSREEVSDLPVDVATQISSSGTDGSRLVVVANVHLKWLHFQVAAGRHRDSLTVVAALFDHDGGYVMGTKRLLTLALRDDTLTPADPKINVQSAFNMKPGTYLLRVVVREGEASAMSAHNLTVIVR